jgi:hypothetical protein
MFYFLPVDLEPSNHQIVFVHDDRQSRIILEAAQFPSFRFLRAAIS